MNKDFLKKIENLKPKVSFFKVYSPIWILLFLILVSVDLGSKIWITKNLNFNLSYLQYKNLPTSDIVTYKALSVNPISDGKNQIDIIGNNGSIFKLRLVFNDRFVFGLGPNIPYLGIILSFLATVFLIFYHWFNSTVGNTYGWLLVFSGAFGNLIDKMFVKSLLTREWMFSLKPKEGYISGVVDFFECIWFGFAQLKNIFILNFLSMETLANI